jgi:hypothetical protein
MDEIKMALKKTNQETLKSDDSYFVSLKSPLEFRRQILECSKKSLYGLQNYQRILLIRQKKLKELESLKQSLKEIEYISRKLNEKLPPFDSTVIDSVKPRIEKAQLKIPVQKVAAAPVSKSSTSGKPVLVKPAVPTPKAIVPVKPIPVPVVVKEKTELEKLEDSLADIEGKLQRLQ